MDEARAWLYAKVARGKVAVFGVAGTLTPSIAALLLHECNHVVWGSALEEYKRTMRTGGWILTGEPIIISIEGILNNGHHRCTAVVATGIGIPVMFVFGVQNGVYKKTDNPAARTIPHRIIGTLRRMVS